VDDAGGLYWCAYRAHGATWNFETWRYDPGAGTHTLVLDWPIPSVLPSLGNWGPTAYRLADLRDGYLLVAGLYSDFGDDTPDTRLTLFDLGTGTCLWNRRLGADIDPTVAPTGAASGPTVRMARLGADGQVYASGFVTNRSGSFGANTDVLPGFWCLDRATGDLEASYGRYAGGENNANEGWPNNVKVSQMGDFDVNADGEVVVAVNGYAGTGIARLTPSYGVHGDGDSDQYGYVGDGYEEEWFVSDGKGDQVHGGGSDGRQLTSWPTHDGSGGAYHAGGGKLRHCDGVSLVAWERGWGAAHYTSAGGAARAFGVSPGIMRRGDDGKVHTSTTGGLVYDPEGDTPGYPDCDLPPEEPCCEKWGSAIPLTAAPLGCDRPPVDVTLTEVGSGSPRVWEGAGNFCGDTHRFRFVCDEEAGDGCGDRFSLTVFPGCGDPTPMQAEITGCDCESDPPTFSFLAVRDAYANAGCKCCEDGSGADCDSCADPTDTPSEVQVTASGFSGCGSSNFNGTFLLPQVNFVPCTYQLVFDGGLSIIRATVDVATGGKGRWTVTFLRRDSLNDVAQAAEVYEFVMPNAGDRIDCMAGPVTVPFSSENIFFPCSARPASVTLQPLP
jgi:hypothetical protein